MEIVDLRHFGSVDLRPLLEKEAQQWVEALAWDYRGSAEMILRYVDAKILPGLDQLTFVFDHPTAITPLAKLKPGSQGLVERFECFGGHEELANAYTELNDPADQQARFEEQVRMGTDEVREIDTDFVTALKHGMPPAGGLGIGIDRLVMILTNSPSIRDVLLFPLLRPLGPENAEKKL
jgi:lysyl-tRNA synthetase class 2